MSLTDVDGVRVGHWTDADARTGCTAVLLPRGTVTSGEVRGSAPATREFALLDPRMSVAGANAVVLSGGSAYGLAAGDGAMRWLEEHGIGFDTPAGLVPIVVGLSCFDLMVGDPSVRPGPDQGYAACDNARSPAEEYGRIGAGAGCTIGKWADPDEAVVAGLGSATIRDEGLVVSAMIVCNAVGWVGERRNDLPVPFWVPGLNTTIGMIVTNARLDKVGCLLLAQSGHDGYARAIEPSHTGLDGDALVVAATGEVDVDRELCRALAARVVEDALRAVPLGD